MLVGASSLTLRTAEHRADVVGRHAVGGDGRLRLDLPARSQLAGALARQGEAVATIEVTDVAPTPVRDRVRGRGSLTGWLTPVAVGADRDGAGDLTVVLDLAAAEVSTAGASTAVDPDEFAAAEPDPLAADEAELLCHLDGQHPHTVRQLCRLVDRRDLRGVRRVTPVRLDRHGLVLRIERAGGQHDARLAFTPMLRHADELGGHIAELLDRSARCRRRWL
ncbi:DUF2470 domain-containing protein [Micromonospora sp. NPDC047074]|uniref:DUF2470 domain-containing protein n=1 Tax=Micromonospora sp. NPDC047074 TaxID=3154339 RepID=UPI0033ECE7A5